MSEDFDIRFSEQGAKEVVQSMRQVNAEATGAARKVEDLSDSLSRVKAKADPAGNAYQQLAKNLDILQRSTQANLLTQGQQERLSNSLIKSAEAQLRPFSSLISNIQRETQAWTQNSTVRTASLRTMQQQQTLQRSGIALNAEEVASLEATNLAYVQQREAALAAESAERQRAAAAVAASRATEAAIQRETAARARRDATVGNLLNKNRSETAAVGVSGSSADRNAQLRTIQQIEALKKSGIELTADENAELTKTNQAYAEQRDRLSQLNLLKRQLASVQNIGGNPVQEARNRYSNARNVVSQAGAAGLIGPAQQAQLERQLTSAFEAQTNPLVRSNQLLAQRAEYQTGLFNSGRALAQVERDISRAQELGIETSALEVASLRSRAREIDNVERAYSKINSIKGLFNSTVGGIGLLFGAEGLKDAFDQVQNIQNLLSITSKGTGNQASVTGKIFDISRDTHAEVEDTAKLYSRINLNAERFGFSQQQVLDLTKEVNEQLRLSGTSQGEATRATIDFVHAIGSGNLQYRELRALTQQAPFVAKSIADGLTKLAQLDAGFASRARQAGVNVDKGIGVADLKELTSHHALGGGDVFKAEALQAADTEAAFRKLSPTISQALTDVHTEFLRYVNDLNNSTGAAKGIAGSIDFIADHLKEIIPVLLTFGSILVGLFVRNTLKEFGSVVSVFTKNMVSAKVAVTEASVADNINTGAVEANNSELAVQNGLLAANTQQFNASTAAISANEGIRSRANLTTGNGPVNGFGRRGGATASESAVASGPLTTQRLRGIGAAANEGAGIGAAAVGAEGAAGAFTKATGAASGFLGVVTRTGGAVSGFVGGLLGGLADAIPLVFALGAAWLLLKDNINVATNQTLLYNDNGITKATQGTVTLGDVADGVFKSITGGQDALTQHQLDAVGLQTDAQKKAAKDQADAAVAAFNRTGNAYDTMQNGILKKIVDLVGSFEVGAIAIQNFWGNMVDAIYEHVLITFRKIANVFIDLYNNSIVPIANAGKSVGIGGGATALPHSNLGVGPVFAGGQTAAQRAAQRQSNLVNENANVRGVIAGDILNAAGQRTAGRGTGVSSGDTGDEPFDSNGKHKKGHVDPLIAKFDELTKQLLPAIEAITKFHDEMDTLQKAIDKGLVQQLANRVNTFDRDNPGSNLALTPSGQITQDQLVARFKAAANERLQDAVDPTRVFERNNTERTRQLGPQGNAIGTQGTSKFNLEIANQVYEQEKKEADQLHVTVAEIDAVNGARIRASATLAAQAQLIAKTNDALAESNAKQALELSQIGESTELIQAQTEAYAIYKDEILAGIAGAQQAYQQQVQTNLGFIAYTENVNKTKAAYEAIIAPSVQFRDTVVNLNNLLSAGKISLTQYNEELRDGTAKALAGNRDAMSGVEEAFLDIKKKSEDAAADMKSVFEDAYNNIEEGFSSLFTGGNPLQALQNTLKGITGDLSKALFHKVTDPLISSIAGPKGLNIPGFGDKAVTASRVDLNATTVYVNGQTGVAGSGIAPAYQSPANDNFLNSTGNAGLNTNLTNLGIGNLNPAGALLSGDGTLTGLTPFPGALPPGAQQSSNFLNGFGSALGNGFSGLTTGIGKGLTSLSGLPVIGGALGTAGSAFNLGSVFGSPGAGTAGIGGSSLGGQLAGAAGGLLGGGAGAGAPVPVTIVGGSSSGLSSLLGGLGGGSSGGGLGSLLGGAGGAGGAGGFLSGLSSIGSLFGFATGGSFDVPGHGGTDSKIVAFKATPGENVDVKTPGQKNAAANDSGGHTTLNQKIVNVIDPSMAIDAMNTEAGFKVVLNHIQSNPEAVKRALA